jgi:hypothetical protein
MPRCFAVFDFRLILKIVLEYIAALVLHWSRTFPGRNILLDSRLCSFKELLTGEDQPIVMVNACDTYRRCGGLSPLPRQPYKENT